MLLSTYFITSAIEFIIELDFSLCSPLAFYYFVPGIAAVGRISECSIFGVRKQNRSRIGSLGRRPAIPARLVWNLRKGGEGRSQRLLNHSLAHMYHSYQLLYGEILKYRIAWSKWWLKTYSRMIYVFLLSVLLLISMNYSCVWYCAACSLFLEYTKLESDSSSGGGGGGDCM